MTFQTNIWQMIKQSMQLGKKKCNSSGKGKWVTTYEFEDEDLHYKIEWMKIMISGSPEFEQEEYEDALKLYGPLGKILKKEFKIPENNPLRKQFKTKLLSEAKVNEAYKKGYGAASDSNMANKLLEMGILTHIELIKS